MIVNIFFGRHMLALIQIKYFQKYIHNKLILKDNIQHQYIDLIDHKNILLDLVLDDGPAVLQLHYKLVDILIIVLVFPIIVLGPIGLMFESGAFKPY